MTWALDPALIDDVRAMERSYTVHTATGTRSGTGKAAATRWLDELKQDVATADFLGVPYADPDVTAAAHAGLARDVQVASTQGDSLLTHTFGGSPLPYAWPPDGFADQRTLDTFFAAGETTVVLDSAALPIVGAQPSGCREQVVAHDRARDRGRSYGLPRRRGEPLRPERERVTQALGDGMLPILHGRS